MTERVSRIAGIVGVLGVLVGASASAQEICGDIGCYEPILSIPRLPVPECPGNDPDDIMIKVGPLCVDVYEASVWNARIQKLSAGCDRNGNNCTQGFARSVKGVTPLTDVSWFQAQQFCANAGKRLLTNAEWQMAAAGTPDPGNADDNATTCNTTIDEKTKDPADTGSRASCVSNHGVNDMVGNVAEWVADWLPKSIGSSLWENPCAPGYSCEGYADDYMGVFGAEHEPGSPGAVDRGGNYASGSGAGVFAVSAVQNPAGEPHVAYGQGFRCAR